ncbi:MAG TPA: diacylglycerol kinase family protein [Acidimicrobiales bacterium]|nr:diacylglycerol kinase family protein [Acidimicrobiales bacterium]
MNRLKKRCREVAASNGWEPLFLDSTPEEGTWGEGVAALSRCVVAAGVRLVFAVGGDGTVGACAHALAGTGASLAILPRGTANLVAHALGVPLGLEAALAVGFSGHERQVDLAVADGRTVVAMAGMGLDATVVQATPALLKERLGWLGYAVAGLSCLHDQPHEFEVRLDGGESLIRRAQAVVVGNVGILPGGFVLLPGARLDDGLLDVGVVAPEGPLGWALLAGRVLARNVPTDGVVVSRVLAGSRHPPYRYLEHYQAHQVEIRADVELPREVDGEIVAPGRSLTVGLHHKALTVRVPFPPSTTARTKTARPISLARSNACLRGSSAHSGPTR